MTDATLKRIYEASLNFLIPLTPEKTYATIVKEATKLVGAQWGSVLLEQNGELKRAYSSIPSDYQIKHRKRGFLYKAFKKSKPTSIKVKEIEKVHPEIKNLKIVSDVIIPLSYRKKSIGILAILSKREEPLNTKEINILVLFGSMASLAIRKAQLLNETKKALETKDFFISAAAHEIKTPVTTIFGYAQLLSSNTKAGKKPKTEWIESLQSECHRLKSLINDFLEISRINIGTVNFHLQECHIKKIIQQVTESFKFNHPNRQLVLEDHLRNNDLFVGDSDKIIQAILNLLDNAAKFSPNNTEIFLTLKTNKTDFIVTVKDQGKGIDKDDLPKVFERYFKGKGNQNEGLGLGLFLVKTIIEYHHGSVFLHSKLNKGTTVEIKLPKVKI